MDKIFGKDDKAEQFGERYFEDNPDGDGGLSIKERRLLVVTKLLKNYNVTKVRISGEMLPKELVYGLHLKSQLTDPYFQNQLDLKTHHTAFSATFFMTHITLITERRRSTTLLSARAKNGIDKVVAQYDALSEAEKKRKSRTKKRTFTLRM